MMTWQNFIFFLKKTFAGCDGHFLRPLAVSAQDVKEQDARIATVQNTALPKVGEGGHMSVRGFVRIRSRNQRVALTCISPEAPDGLLR